MATLSDILSCMSLTIIIYTSMVVVGGLAMIKNIFTFFLQEGGRVF